LPPDRVGEVVSTLERIAREGLPNAFGAQRFGRDRDNADRARAWLSGRAPAPRDVRMKKLLWSSLQSELFNEVLARRVGDGTWATPLEGDLVKRRSSGGLFLCTDVQMDRMRAAEGEVSPTGPMFGVKMREPEGAPLVLERAVLAEKLGDGIDFAATKAFGEGTRRALRLWVEDLRVEPIEAEIEPQANAAREQASSIRVYFVLPKGAYATTVLSTAMTIDDIRISSDGSDSVDTGRGAPASAIEPRDSESDETDET
jgi:tRNA pseudouridine13 synthase